MLDAARYEKRITGLRFEPATRVLEDQMAADDVDQLLVRVTVTSPHPAFLHTMAHQHHAWAVRHYLATQALFWIGHVAVIGANNIDVVLGHEGSPEVLALRE